MTAVASAARSFARWAWAGDLPAPVKAALLLLWAVAVVYVTAHHEPWRDEADTWLAARDLALEPGALRRFTACVGTPALWFGALMPLAKGGAPYWTASALHLLLAAAAVALVVWRSPLPPVLRALLPFSFMFGYEHAVIARSYVLTVLLLLLSAALHQRRRERPLAAALVIGLLANTNAHGFFLAFALGVGLVLDLAPARPPRWREALGLALALGALALWQLFPRSDGQFLLPQADPLNNMVVAIASGVLPRAPGAPSLWDLGLVARFVVQVSSAGLVVLAVLGTRRRADRAALLLGLGGLLFIFGWKNLGDVRHHVMLLALLLWALWLHRAAPDEGDARSRRHMQALTAGLALALLAGLPTLLGTWRLEVEEPFSGSREAADYLRAQGLDAGPIAAHRPNQTSAVLPHLRARTLWYAGLEADGSHMAWDLTYMVAQHRVSVTEAAARTARRFPAGTCLLLSEPLPEPERHGFRLVFQSTRPAFRCDEVYWIYRLNAAGSR